jgi:hypothetical protein
LGRAGWKEREGERGEGGALVGRLWAESERWAADGKEKEGLRWAAGWVWLGWVCFVFSFFLSFFLTILNFSNF